MLVRMVITTVKVIPLMRTMPRRRTLTPHMTYLGAAGPFPELGVKVNVNVSDRPTWRKRESNYFSRPSSVLEFWGNIQRKYFIG